MPATLTLESTSAAFDKAAGVFTLRRQGTQDDLVVKAMQLPPHTKAAGYAVWLANPDGAWHAPGLRAHRPKARSASS